MAIVARNTGKRKTSLQQRLIGIFVLERPVHAGRRSEGRALIELAEAIWLWPDLETLRQSREEGAADPILRRADADAGAVSDFIDRVANIQHVKAQFGRLREA